MDRLLGLLVRILVWLAGYSKRLARIGIGQYDEWHPGRKLKILLVGYNGARNTGADARVAAIARQLKDIFNPDQIEITVMALDTDNLQGYFDPDVKLYKFTTLFPWPLYRACCASHMAVLSEGSALKSTFADALTLFFCQASGIMRRQHKPCIAYGTEAGQMDDFLKKISADLCRGTYFIARTREAMDVLRSLNLKGHAGTDTAWCYDGAISDEAARVWLMEAGWDGKKPCIGAAVINPFCWPVKASLARWIRGRITGHMEDCYDKWYFFSRSPQRTQAFERYIDGIASAINRYSREHDAFVTIIGMEKLDKEACHKLAARLDEPSAILLSADQSADIMTGVLRQMSMLVTSRYHAAVLSMEKAIPVIAVSMDERLDSLLGECGLDEDYLLHAADEDLEDGIYQRLVMAADRRDLIHEAIRRQTDHYRKELDQMGIFLRKFTRHMLEKQYGKNAAQALQKQYGKGAAQPSLQKQYGKESQEILKKDYGKGA